MNPNEQLYLGLDLGTTNCKCGVYNSHFEMLSEYTLGYPIYHNGDMATQNADDWWNAAKECIKKALENSGSDKKNVMGISISSQGISFLPVDKSGTPLSESISWLDNRAKVEVSDILEQISEQELYEITGIMLTPAYILPKLLWLRKNEKTIWENTSKIFTAHEYIQFKLCGQAAISHTMAAGTMLFDIHSLTWSQKLSTMFSIPAELFSPLRASGLAVGVLTEQAALELDLPQTVKVFNGGQDQKCAYLGAYSKPDAITVSLGTSSAISKRCNHVLYDETHLISCAPFLDGKTRILEGVVGTAGACMKWLKSTICPDLSYSEMDKEAVQVLKNGGTDLLFCSDFSYTRKVKNKELPGGAFEGLSLSTSRGEFCLSVMEGVSFGIKRRIDLIENINQKTDEIVIFGGGAQSDIWCRLLADITGKKVIRAKTAETASRGAAMLAAGLLQCEGEKNERFFMPNESKTNYYKEKYSLYLSKFYHTND